MKYCMHCGLKLLEEARFCSSCGEVQTAVIVEKENEATTIPADGYILGHPQLSTNHRVETMSPCLQRADDVSLYNSGKTNYAAAVNEIKRCNVCGEIVGDNGNVCMYCGNAIQTTRIVTDIVPAKARAVISVRTIDGQKRCSICGEKSSGGSTCEYCGNEITRQVNNAKIVDIRKYMINVTLVLIFIVCSVIICYIFGSKYHVHEDEHQIAREVVDELLYNR